MWHGIILCRTDWQSVLREGQKNFFTMLDSVQRNHYDKTKSNKPNITGVPVKVGELAREAKHPHKEDKPWLDLRLKN